MRQSRAESNLINLYTGIPKLLTFFLVIVELAGGTIIYIKKRARITGPSAAKLTSPIHCSAPQMLDFFVQHLGCTSVVKAAFYICLFPLPVADDVEISSGCDSVNQDIQ